MKSLQIQNTAFNTILNSFKGWLGVQLYANDTILNMPIHLREFFHYLEVKGHEGITYVTTNLVTEYYEYLSSRKNKTRGGALSNGTLNKHQQSLKLFLTYLKEHSANFNFGVHLRTEKINDIDVKDILSIEQMKQLFEACSYSHISSRYQLRDKAMLTILYSCGLRRNEAVMLDIKDVMFDEKLIHVRFGKGSKERKVAINDYNLRILEDYIYEARPQFYKSKTSDALFINKNGNRMQGKSYADRLEKIVEATEDDGIQSKHITLHGLRHSIATHFLQAGMPLEKISRFLGHSSLESTQRYVRIVNLLEDE